MPLFTLILLLVLGSLLSLAVFSLLVHAAMALAQKAVWYFGDCDD